MRNFYLIIFFFGFISNGFAQLSDVHYLPPLKQGGNNQAIQQQAYYLSTPVTTAFDVNVYYGTNPNIQETITISNTVSGKHDVNDGDNEISLVTNDNTGIVLSDSGLRFEAPGGQEFYVNYRGKSQSQGASLTSKGRSAAGINFKWGGIPNRGNQSSLTTSLGIMAIDPGVTTVNLSDLGAGTTFRLGANADGLSGTSHQIELLQYQTFVFESFKGTGTTSPNIDGWLGASVQSDQNIVISNGGLNVGVRSGAGGRDAGMDQPVPTNVLGREYVFIRGNGNANNETEFPIIVATSDNTEIFVNNSITPIATIDEGDYFEIPGSNYSMNSVGGNMYVETSKDVYAYQCLTGNSNYFTLGLNFIAPVNCLLPENLDNIPNITDVDNNVFNGGITIVTDVNFNDNTIEVTDDNGANTYTFLQVSTSDWKSVYIPNLTGDVKVNSSGPIAVGFLGVSGAAGLAGYFSGFDTVPVVKVDITGGGCFPGSDIQEATGGFDSYQWFKDGVAISGATTQTFDPSTTGIGEYSVEVDDNGCIYESATVSLYSCNPDIQIIKIDDVDPIEAGSNITFTITAESFSVNEVTNLIISDTLPSELTLVSATPSAGTIWSSPDWTIAAIQPGEKFELEIVAKANDDASGTVINEILDSGIVFDDKINETNLEVDDLIEPVTITPCNFAQSASSTPTLCVNSVLTDITHTTTIATGIGTPTGLPPGVTANWSSDVITISGTPTLVGVFNYNIPLTGGCNTVSATGTITINDLPIATVITGVNEVCVGGTITLTEGASGTIVWNSSNTGVATIDAAGELTGISAGTTDITYTVTDINGCTSLSSSVYTITVNGLPVFGTLTTNSAICEGDDAEFYVTGTANSVLTYNLNSGADEIAILNASGEATIVLSVATSDVIINLISLENASTSCLIVLSNSETIVVNPNPILASVSDIIVCDNTSITEVLDANDAITQNSDTNIVWYDAATGGSIVANPVVNTPTPSTDLPTSFFAQIESTNTPCVNPVREEVKLQIVSPPFPDLLEEVCSGEALNIGLSFNTTYTVVSSDQANVPAGSSRSLPGLTANITDAYVNTTDLDIDITYTVTIADGSACDGQQFDIVVTVYPESDGGTVSADQKICIGETPADVNVTGIIGDVVKWQQSTSVTFSSFTDIALASSTLTGSTIGALTQNMYFRAVVQNGVCSTTNSSIGTVNVDTLSPVITGTIPEVTVEGCLTTDAPIALTTVTALEGEGLTISDDFTTDVNLIVTSSDVSTSGTCPNILVINRTYTVTDECNNSKEINQTINIEDTTAPTWDTALNALDITLECSDVTGLTSAQALFPVASDLCDSDVSDIVKVSGAFVADAACSQAGSYTNTWTVSDDCTNTSVVYTQVITIEDTTAPTGTAPADITGLECITDVPVADINLITDEADECMGDVSVSVIDINNGGSACTGDPYIVTRTYTLEDCLGLTTDLIQTITVENVSSPIVPANASSTIECITDAIQPATPVVTDVCGNNLTAVITENTDPACEGDKVYTYTYTDCGNNVSVYTYTYTIDRVTLPIVPTNEGSTVNDIVDAIQPAAPVVVDVCGDIITAVITENVSPICDGEKIYTYTYTDCGGNVSVYTYTYTIDVTSTLIISNSITDTCSAVALSYDLTSLTTLPGVTFDWAVIPNTNISGAVNGTGTVISDSITNTSGAVQEVIYTVTPFNENRCEGPSFEVSVTVSPQAELVVTKLTLPATDGIYDTLNEVIQYEITVVNSNDVEVSNISVADLNADLGSILPANVISIPAFGVVTFTASHTITQADLDAGEVINSAVATGTDPCGVVVTDDSDDPNTADQNDDTVTLIEQNPSVSLEKAAIFNDENGDGFPQDGETLSYVFTISNTGNVTLNNIEVSDPLIAVIGSPITLSPGNMDTTTYFGTYVLNQAVIDSGSITNSASVEGESPLGISVVDISDDPSNSTNTDTNGDGEPDDPTVFDLEAAPELTITKTGVFIDANSDGIAQQGETIEYTFDVSNTGNVTISGITISDPIVSVTGGPINLTPLQTDNSSFRAVYTLTQDDVNLGSVTNTAIASGSSPDGSIIMDTSDDPTTSDANDATETTLARDPKLSLFKTAAFNDENNNGFPEEGETITYTFDVRNTGNVTITAISITDPLLTVMGGTIDLDPAETDSTTFTGIYTLLLSDINTGNVTNSATVSGTNPDGGNVIDVSDDPTNTNNVDINGDGDPDDSTVFTLISNAQLSLEKTGGFNDENSDGIAQVGETISYAFTVRNTGNVTVSNINISDPLVTVSGSSINLDPNTNDSTTFSAEYTLTQADINNGGVVNSATAEGNLPDGTTVSDTSDDPNNTTNNDVNGDGEPDDSTNTTLPISTTISLLKEVLPAADGSYDTLGEIINYELTVTNTGNVTLSNVMITDANADSITPSILLTIAPNVSVTILATHQITQVDLDAGTVVNSASVIAEDPFGNTAEDISDDPNNPTDSDSNGDGEPDDTTIIGVNQNPSMSLKKTAVFNDENGDGIPQENETLTYNFEVENTGNVTLSEILITDPLATVNGGPIILAPAEINDSTFFANYTITQADIDSGSINNSATVSAEDPMGVAVTDTSDDPTNNNDIDANGDGEPDDVTVTSLSSAPALRVFKTGVFIDSNSDGIAQLGETVSYTFDITNTGNVTLNNVTITDPLVGVVGVAITLSPGQTDSTTFTASYALTQNNINVGFVENMASGSGSAPNGDVVTDMSDDPTTTNDDATITTLAREPKLSLFKTAIFNDENNDGIPQVNETIHYVFDVRNTGNVTLNNIEVADPLVTVSGGPISLIPGEINNNTFTATYVISQADIDLGGITNSALVTGQDNEGSIIVDVSDFSDDPDNPINEDLNGDGDPDDPTVSELNGQPSLNLNKTAVFNDENNDGFAQSGETISYVFEVTNTGNVSLINIVVTDPLVNVIGSSINLLPTQTDTSTFTANYTLTQLDIDTGGFSNSANVRGEDPNGNPVIDDSDDPTNTDNVDRNNDGNPDDDTVTVFNTFSEITITKEALEALDGAYDTVGENLVYDIIITNTGDTTLTNVVITDTNADSLSSTLIPLLNVGEMVMIEAIHVLTQADLDAGIVNNSANVKSENPFGNTVMSNSDDPNNPTNQDGDGDGNPDDVTVTALDQQPSIALTKTDDNAPDGLWDEVGEVITYTLEVTNTGNVTLTNVVVSDPNADIGSVVPALINILAPNETVELTVSHTITQADLDFGSTTNSATVNAQTPIGDDVMDTSDDPDDLTNNDINGDGDPDDATVTSIPQTASMLVDKTVDNSLFLIYGEVLTYTIQVTNTGTVSLLNVSITDPNADSISPSSIPILAPNEVFLAIATHEITIDDFENGFVANTAVVNALIPNSTESVSENSDDPNNSDNIDSDGDGDSDDSTISYLDPDPDNDGVFTSFEIDSNGDGVGIDDTDGDGIPDYLDADDDGDGILTIQEGSNPDGDGNPSDAFDSDGNGIPDYLEPNAILITEDGIQLFNGFSPNGDGVNDVLVIKGLENLENTVSIYNRWGVKIYETINYGRTENYFEGISNGRVTVKETDLLPVGTYYYLIEYISESEGTKQKVGYIYINR